MPIAPLHGHDAIRARLLAARARGTLPASLLLQGPRGVGKQRLALWLGQVLLCGGAAEAREGGESCGRCQHCRYAGELAHPDLHWVFPRPRLKDGDASVDDVRADYAAVLTERREQHGLYAPPGGLDGLFVPTVRFLVQRASTTPAMAARKVFIVGDAERMVPQESSPEAANALLKLLEEPPADTTLVLTTSEPGALLPTIRSRVVAVRVPPLNGEAVGAFFADPAVAGGLRALGVSGDPGSLAARAGGAPGRLLAGAEEQAADAEAERLLRLARGGSRAERLQGAASQGVSKARGSFSDMLDALARRLGVLSREASVPHGAPGTAPRDAPGALAAARGVEAVERAKQRAAGNVNPQLVTAELMRELAALLR